MKLSARKWITKATPVMARGFGFALVLSALSATAFAAPEAPEMDPGLATSAMALLSGGLLLISGRRSRSK